MTDMGFLWMVAELAEIPEETAWPPKLLSLQRPCALSWVNFLLGGASHFFKVYVLSSLWTPEETLLLLELLSRYQITSTQ